MKKGQNFNRPAKGSRIKVEPITSIDSIREIRQSLLKNPRNLALFTLGTNTCLRPMDLLNIKIGQVLGLESTSKIIIKERKAGKKRHLTLNQACVEAINTLLKTKKEQKTGLNPKDFLFTGQRGPLLLPSLNYLVKKWCADIDLPGNYGSQTLRKTYGYYLINNGTDVTDVMKIFNHSSQYQTIEYLNISPEKFQQIKSSDVIGSDESESTYLDQILKEIKNKNAFLEESVEKLKERDEQFKTIIKNAIDAIIFVDTQGYFLEATESCLAFTGYTRDELKGKNFAQVGFISPEDAQRCLTLINAALKGKPGKPLELKATRKDGSTLFIEAIPKVLKKHGDTIGFLAIVRDITKRMNTADALRKHRDHLEELVKNRTINIEEANTALKVLLKRTETDKLELEDKMLFNIKELVAPYLEKLKELNLDNRARSYVDIIESNINNIISPLMRNISIKYLKLTPAEIRISNLIAQDKTTKEISVLLNLSPRTIEFHRDSIRKKLGINKKKINLKTYLSSIQ